MCWSRLSFVLRPPWAPERPRYPIRLKVRLMDCPGRAGEGSDVPSSDTSSILVRPWSPVPEPINTPFFAHPARPPSLAQPVVAYLLPLRASENISS